MKGTTRAVVGRISLLSTKNLTLNKGGFTLLEVLAASAVISVVSYLIITQIVSLQRKVADYTQLPHIGRFVNNALAEAAPFDVNFRKGNLGNYSNNNYSWQIRKDIPEEICSRYFTTKDAKKECYIDKYVLTVNVGEQTNRDKEENKKELYFLKTIEEEREVNPENEK